MAKCKKCDWPKNKKGKFLKGFKKEGLATTVVTT